MYSSGGGWPHFAKVGKIWTSDASLNRHLSQAIRRPHRDRAGVQLEDGLRYGSRTPLDDLEIVEMEIVETTAAPITDREYVQRRAATLGHPVD